MLSLVHASVTRWRRRHPGRVRRLARPVVSIGNLAAGGRAKSPMTALVARALVEAGERPAILSRGYARERRVEAPVVVRDTEVVRATLAEAGDEPLMLAEALEDAIVVVLEERARAGRVAEQLGATVHVLDDGFQHLKLARDIDVVMIDPRDLDGRVMPSGRLREPIDALAAADAVVLIDGGRDAARDVWMRLAEITDARVFSASRHVDAPPAELAGTRGFLVSGIADPEQLTRSVSEAGWRVAGSKKFKDHHRYSAADAQEIRRAAELANASFVLTTAKDAVRLRGVWKDAMPVHVAQLTLGIDGAFTPWLIEQVQEARARNVGQSRRAREDGERRAV